MSAFRDHHLSIRHLVCPKVVRAIHDGTWIRTLDWRPTPDSKAMCTEAEDGSSRCSSASQVDAGRALSPSVGTQPGEPRSASTALASSPAGADANPHHESAAGGRIE